MVRSVGGHAAQLDGRHIYDVTSLHWLVQLLSGPAAIRPLTSE
uniref:Uncharacterized protein n=1 Tax=Arundo donax TaxID=35708 RepID=A0A0A9SAK6_ARUDO